MYVCINLFCWAGPGIGLFLEIEGIPGESRLVEGAIEVAAFSYDVKGNDGSSGIATGKRQRSVTPDDDGTSTVNKVDMSAISFRSTMGKATPKLMLACATGQHINEAKLTCRKSGGGETYMTIKLEDCFVTSYLSSSTTADPLPMETFSLNFQTATFTIFTGGDPSELAIKFVVKR